MKDSYVYYTSLTLIGLHSTFYPYPLHSYIIQLQRHIVLVNDTGVKKTRYQPRKGRRNIEKKKKPSTEIAN